MLIIFNQIKAIVDFHQSLNICFIGLLLIFSRHLHRIKIHIIYLFVRSFVFRLVLVTKTIGPR